MFMKFPNIHQLIVAIQKEDKKTVVQNSDDVVT